MTTATAMRLWIPWPQPRLFFSTTAYILRNLYSIFFLFYLCWSSYRNYVIATYYFFFKSGKREFIVEFYFSSLLYLNFFNTYYLVELKLYVITATAIATAVINFSTTALEPQPWFSKIPQPKQEPQPRFSENLQNFSDPLLKEIYDPFACPE